MKEKKGKIVPFPHLKERLLEKGMEALQAKRYKEAYEWLEQAKQFDADDADLELAMVVCLFELGEAKEAKKRCQALLEQGKGDWSLYLSILIHLQQYDEVIATIERLQKEGRDCTPFLPLLEFSKKICRSSAENEIKQLTSSLLEQDDWEQHVQIIKQLENKYIEPIVPVLNDYLSDERKHPFVKTMILRLLMSKQVKQVVTIQKFGKMMQCSPIQLDENEQAAFADEVLSIVENKFTQQNPSLYEWVKSIWLRYLYMMYPFVPDEFPAEQWAEALYAFVQQCQGQQTEALHPLIEEIQKIEDISFF
ncbi:tetratricopeptide repeat protein [Thermolongibacillus altinsuensis]|uniref:Tetratricopeptide repeat protein n=1 Tax=Thermolongibacillus altinsuensis TaxID=575256 RepID=A0A4R1QG18_9BACL|nr:tetratricopeptide repeat protein [Thermolongibacillus altinsuensis]TCL51901.1 tetratricopeptide repeat protein [Thermolongibacillus altinsuensis]GMB07435.1 TPR repeat-containing protein YsoA [Thermolongibacillus altinsuensis]